MKLVKYHYNGRDAVGQLKKETILPLNFSSGQYGSLTDVLEADDPQEVAEFLTDSKRPLELTNVQLLPPIDEQEVWAAGVTYRRSQSARMEESETSASCYDRVYVSPRPELFMKATPNRVAGSGQPLRIRQDSKWNVPEPELTLVVNSSMKLVGYTVGNDMSSRDIEGENPLYLPQAKVYDACCGLGPCITLAGGMPAPKQTGIELVIRRGEETVFTGTTNVGQMARTYGELIEWLARDNTFPNGVLLMTGTGIVPDSSFTLHAGDVVEIRIDGIGTLRNPVIQG
jgi:2-dehydro-3-deoxy-D-arabinonate dehydratase